jgi:hypothetical protein
MVGTPCIQSLFFGFAGIEVKRQICRAKPEYACRERYDAKPAPDSDQTRQCRANQPQSEQDSNDTINTAYVCFHDDLLKKSINPIWQLHIDCHSIALD